MMYDWRDDAACKGKPLDWFYPPSNDANEEAKKVCEDCPVRQECLEYALKNEDMGIWGGLTARERRQLRSTLGVELVEPQEEPRHLSCGTNNGYQWLLRQAKINGTKIQFCLPCYEAHRLYNSMNMRRSPSMKYNRKFYAQKRYLLKKSGGTMDKAETAGANTPTAS